MIEDQEKHWVYRASSKPKLWIIMAVILVLAIIPEFFISHHGNFEDQGVTIDHTFGFYAWYGFITCAAMVIAAKVLGVFLKRADSYYDEQGDD